MQQLAREKHHLVLLRNNSLVAPLAHIRALFQPRIVNSQLSPLETTRLAMEEVHEGQGSSRDPLASVVAVEMKEIAIVAGGDLRLHSCDCECFHPEFL
jgi:hypothetical protein